VRAPRTCRPTPRRSGRSAWGALREAEPVDDVDLVTKADLSGDLELEIALHEAGAHLRDVNVIASPAQELRNVFA
jgi:hypothetical protein